MKTEESRFKLRIDRLKSHYMSISLDDNLVIDGKEVMTSADYENFCIKEIYQPLALMINNGLNSTEAIREIIKQSEGSTEASISKFICLIFGIENIDELTELVISGEAEERIIDKFPWKFIKFGKI